jgi:hypothetical protein
VGAGEEVSAATSETAVVAGGEVGTPVAVADDAAADGGTVEVAAGDV